MTVREWKDMKDAFFIVWEVSLRNFSLSIFYVQFYFLLSVFYFLLLLFFTIFYWCKAQTDIKAFTVLFKTTFLAMEIGRKYY